MYAHLVRFHLISDGAIMYQFVKKTEDRGIVTLLISRPERRNGLGPSIGGELRLILTDLKAATDAYLNRSATDSTPRALVIRADTTNDTWIAGGDLKELCELDPIGVREYAELWTEICLLLRQLAIPTIAIIEGACIGGGVEFALSADFRLITPAATLVFKQLAAGLTLGYGTSSLMMRLLGEARARSLILGTKTLQSEDIINLGLAESCLKPDQVEAALDTLISKLKSLSPQAIAAQKRMFLSLDSESEMRLFQGTWGNPEHQKFLSKFRAEK